MSKMTRLCMKLGCRLQSWYELVIWKVTYNIHIGRKILCFLFVRFHIVPLLGTHLRFFQCFCMRFCRPPSPFCPAGFKCKVFLSLITTSLRSVYFQDRKYSFYFHLNVVCPNIFTCLLNGTFLSRHIAFNLFIAFCSRSWRPRNFWDGPW